jgi:hypothetical protein
MKGSAEGRLSKMIGTWPATVSFSAGPAPRYGMWVMNTPARLLYSSVCRWPIPPVPELTRRSSLPGDFFSTATKEACSPWPESSGCTAITLGVAAMLMTGTKSVIGS